MKALRYNEGKPKYSLIDLEAFEQCARVLDYGAKKYTIYVDKGGNEIKGSEVTLMSETLKVKHSGRDNWKNGLKKSEVLDSMLRHITALRNGEELDPESGLSHIGHIQCNAMFLGSKNLIDDINGESL